MLPDTHAHLDASAFDEDRDEVIARAVEAGVDRILAVGSDLPSSECAVRLARRYPSVYAAVGIDPFDADRFALDGPKVKTLLDEEKVVAIGEIGLDYERSDVPRDVQREAFDEQLQWAAVRALPVSVHNRNATDDVVDALDAAGVRAVLHCFSGDESLARSAAERGWYLSFAGNLTFKNAAHLREVAAGVPPERVLVESDAPVLAPQPWRGRRNEPAYVRATAQVLAALYGEVETVTARRISASADAVFRWRSA